MSREILAEAEIPVNHILWLIKSGQPHADAAFSVTSIYSAKKGSMHNLCELGFCVQNAQYTQFRRGMDADFWEMAGGGRMGKM
jgi:hypothetical protein